MGHVHMERGIQRLTQAMVQDCLCFCECERQNVKTTDVHV